MIDRTTPSIRPTGPNAGTQSWRQLLFCHWEIPVAELRAVIPAALEIDTFDGRGYVGVVPFKMRQVRPRWLPRVLATHFLETNVRTYVVKDGKPGVFFFSLDANSRLAVWAARAGWSLPYHFATMDAHQHDDLLHYESRRRSGAMHSVSFRVGSELGPSQVGTLEHFLLERYLLFVQRKDVIYEGQVHHQPYHAFVADVKRLNDGLIATSGLPQMTRPPDLAHYCEGVDVEVFSITPT